MTKNILLRSFYGDCIKGFVGLIHFFTVLRMKAFIKAFDLQFNLFNFTLLHLLSFH
jgi:hypothetical protein